MPEILQSTFDVPLDRDTYTFRIPGIKHDIEVGYRAADVRRRAYPEAMGAISTLDWQAANFARYCALLELYLVRSTSPWPYGFSDGDDIGTVDFSKPPQVDFEKFPIDRADTVMELGAAFDQEVARFRRRGNPGKRPAGAEAVDGLRDPGAP